MLFKKNVKVVFAICILEPPQCLSNLPLLRMRSLNPSWRILRFCAGILSMITKTSSCRLMSPSSASLKDVWLRVRKTKTKMYRKKLWELPQDDNFHSIRFFAKSIEYITILNNYLGSLNRKGQPKEPQFFVFMLTEKDSAKIRYGMCLNFYRSFDRKEKLTSKEEKR